MRFGRFVSLASVLAAGTAIGAPVVTGPTATYWMSVSTATGMGGMAAGMAGGGRPDYRSMMSGGVPDFNAANKSLRLQLGSREHPQGDPTAEHDPPEALGTGPVLPLVTPQVQAAPVEEAPSTPPQFHQPQGRMLIFWGCGEHAPAGQPIVIDFSTLGQAGGAQKMMGLMRPMQVAVEQPPSPARSTTYGEWPNAESRARVPPTGSLVGAHTVKGDYSPTIQFTLGADQDFLGPLRLSGNQKNASGSATLAWDPVGRAGGYFATMFGAENAQQIVMWTSSAAQASAFSMPEYLPDGEIRRLVAAGALMPASQTSCTIPVEAVQAAGRAGFYRLIAFGGESNISFPPRPPAPKPWNIAWTVKVRYRSETSGILGVNLGGRASGAEQNQDQSQTDQPQKKKSRASSFLQGLGAVVP